MAKGVPTKTRRNLAVVTRHKNGESQANIARDLDLSRQRVHKIIARAALQEAKR